MRWILILSLLTLASCAKVGSEWGAPLKRGGLSRPICLQAAEVVILGDFDTTKILREHARRVNRAKGSLVEAINDFTREGLRDRKNSGIRLCADLETGADYADQIFLDSVSIIKGYPDDPRSTSSGRGSVEFTYHSEYSAIAALYFRIPVDSGAGAGVIRYKGKIGGNDWNDTRGAIRIMIRELVESIEIRRDAS